MNSPYQVVIDISMGGNAALGIGRLGKEMAGLEETSKRVNKQFDAMKAIIAGGFVAGFGDKLLGGIEKVLKSAGDFQHVQSQMVSMGMQELDIANAIADARKLGSQYTHVTMQEIMEMNRHGIEIFGGADAAREHMGEMAKLADLQEKWQAGHTGVVGPNVVTSIRDMMKTAEGGILWGNDPKKFDVFADNLMKSLWATGANVSASQYVKAARSAKGAFPGWDDSFKFGVFPAMVQEWQGAGVGASTAYNKLGAGSKWTKQGILEGQSLGLVDQTVDATHPFTMRAENVAGHQLFLEDPKKWFDTYAKPALDSVYGEITQANMGNRNAALIRMLKDPNAAEFIDRFDREGLKYEKDRKLRDSAMLGMPEDFDTAIVAFQAKWKDLMVALGAPSMGTATELLGKLTRGIMSMTNVFNAHPDLARNLIAVGAGVGAMAVGLGSLALGYGIVSLLPGGKVIVGLGTLAAALGNLAVVNWPALTEHIKPATKSLNDAFADLYKTFAKFDWKGVITKDIADLVGGINQLGIAIKDAFLNMINSIKGVLPGLPGGGTQLPRPGGHPGEAPGDKVQHGSLVPPAKHLAINIPVTVQMDSRKLAAVVTNQMVASATYPTSASGADGRGQWLGPSAYATEQG